MNAMETDCGLTVGYTVIMQAENVFLMLVILQVGPKSKPLSRIIIKSY